MSTCRLCGKEAELQLSHIVPAFIFRWKRETSANGYMRAADAPNKRVQDGIKRYWLCKVCEDRFSRAENRFAAHVFYPFANEAVARVRYGPWLMQFAASLVWRVYTLYREDKHLTTNTPDELLRLENAAQIWKEYLLGTRRHPGEFQLHVLPCDGIESASKLEKLPPNMNRYMMRGLEMDIAHGRTVAYVYAKIPRFMFMGFARLDHPAQWVGTKIHATEGLIEPRRYTVPQAFGDYIMSRARRAAEILASISPRQRERINMSMRTNMDKLAGSDLIRAMDRDVRLFGDDAFDKG